MTIHIRNISPEEMEGMNLADWPIWTCPVSQFEWEYDRSETCYILEGEVEVTTKTETVKFGMGNLVTFPKGLKCHWNVIKPVKKYYSFQPLT